MLREKKENVVNKSRQFKVALVGVGRLFGRRLLDPADLGCSVVPFKISSSCELDFGELVHCGTCRGVLERVPFKRFLGEQSLTT